MSVVNTQMMNICSLLDKVKTAYHGNRCIDLKKIWIKFFNQFYYIQKSGFCAVSFFIDIIEIYDKSRKHFIFKTN